MFHYVKSLFAKLFGTATPVAPPADIAPPTPEAVAEPAPEPAPLSALQPVEDPECEEVPDSLNSAFRFKGNILDQLDKYFVQIRRLRAWDKPAYDLYSQLGASLTPDTTLYQISPNAVSRHGVRPAFGAIAFSCGIDDACEQEVLPAFMYFTKLARAPNGVEHVPVGAGTIYQFVELLTAVRGKRLELPLRSYFLMRPDGTVKLLKERTVAYVQIKTKKGHDSFSIPKRRWDYPELLRKFFGRSEEVKAKFGNDVQSFFESCFLMAFNKSIEATMDGGIRVTVRKNGDAAAFNIDMKRTAYFFKDREPVTDEVTGHTLRIFHVVRPHERKYKNRETTTGVKMHFRGLREFEWQGYDIRITVPGRDHTSLEQFSVPAHHMEPGERKPHGDYGMKQIGAMLANDIAA